jgi:hypothetical protein
MLALLKRWSRVSAASPKGRSRGPDRFQPKPRSIVPVNALHTLVTLLRLDR